MLLLIVATVTCALFAPALSDNVSPFVYPDPPSTISTAVTLPVPFTVALPVAP